MRLAISLHGATNAVREQIMPINKRYPLERLLPAAKAFQQKHGRMLTLEFILIEGVNDSLEQAHALTKIAKDLHAHVNCIPYNTVEGLPWRRPSIRRQDTFVDVLRRAGVSVTIRREKGHDIEAACGQLRLKTEKEMVEECALKFTFMVSSVHTLPRRIADMVASERPQERLERLGATALSDRELLAMILRSGPRGFDVLQMSGQLLQTAGSLAALLRWSAEDFMRIRGIGRVKSHQLLAVMQFAKRILEEEDSGETSFHSPDQVAH